ncbi:MAG: prolipoprotein diacylglyceryl transferase [Deltaproteobacteria bacterium]|nr:prolipoprotein diacylglyceryl transferase [Deltaproteobacteria bacterium]MBW1928395.1 prolipoprotein diacylglyceryl transferase [Deltaproteobacteria bacterium]MBW2023806.1 prolipoprotein diacylglyceryl transferase [Deltaproteobacteria bacterium]MBW2124581.1 prolipoprotein diacylglyceryl transferase [Deltaproteobacteria bacterium]RLB19268.1 MAG: hypothetical protein DRG63_01180 [Deltaproteobacteria bacterium]
MHPELLHLGRFTIHSYGAFAAAGLLASFVFCLQWAKGQDLGTEDVLGSGLLMVFGGVFVARLIQVSMHWSQYLHHYVDILKIWQSGMLFTGGLVGGLLALGLYSQLRGLSYWRIGDLWAPAAALGQAIGRIGYLLDPTHLYSVLAEGVIFSILIWLEKRKTFEGQILLWYLILESNARLLVERYKGVHRGQFLGTEMNITQFLATVLLVCAVVTLLIKSHKSKGKTKDHA